MKATVIIPNHNGKDYLEICLQSLYRQSFVDFEIIVVDNDSEDGSCKLVAENYWHVNLIRLEENFGFSRAVNEGIKAARGDYVVLLNNDTEAAGDWLEQLLDCIEKDENIFSCASKMIQYHNRSKIDDAGDQYTVMGWPYRRGYGFSVNKYNRDREVFSSCAGAAAYRKEILEKIGNFDQDFFAYLEDIDICYRAKIYGYKNIFCSKARVYHIGSATTGSRYNSFKVRLTARNNIFLIHKNMPFLQILLNSPFIISGSIIKFIFFWQKGLRKDYLAGIKEGLKGTGDIEKVSFRGDRLLNYLRIEIELIKNTVNYVIQVLFNK